MGCGNSGCNCCGGFTSPPATPRVNNLLGVNPNNQVLLRNPTTKSLCYFDPVTGYVTWQDGSSGTPICLPQLQTVTDLNDIAYMVGMTTGGCLVRIALVPDQSIGTCEGPVLTVPVTKVT